MLETKQPNFDAPIPGMALTSELGSRPWNTPAQLTDIEDVVSYYTMRMDNDEFADQLVDVMSMGIPLTTLANTIQLAGVMEGKHSIDAGILALPVIMEMMMAIGDGADVNYTSGLSEDAPLRQKDRTTMAFKTIDKLKKENTTKSAEEQLPEKLPVISEEVLPTGLMARRT